MTTLTLNLLAEEQQAEIARARDPLKIVLAIGISCVTLTVIIGVILSLVAAKKHSTATNLEDQWNALNGSPEVAEENAFQEVKRCADDIVALNSSRSVYAPELATIKDLVPSIIQLNRLIFSISSETKNPPPTQPVEEDGDGTKRIVRPRVVERLTLLIDGKVVSDRPEIDVDDFIKTLREAPPFQGRANAVQLRSLGRSASSGKDAQNAVSEGHFVIECLYKERS